MNEIVEHPPYTGNMIRASFAWTKEDFPTQSELMAIQAELCKQIGDPDWVIDTYKECKTSYVLINLDTKKVYFNLYTEMGTDTILGAHKTKPQEEEFYHWKEYKESINTKDSDTFKPELFITDDLIKAGFDHLFHFNAQNFSHNHYGMIKNIKWNKTEQEDGSVIVDYDFEAKFVRQDFAF